MIVDFKCKETKLIYEGSRSRKFPTDIQKRAWDKLKMLNAAITLQDLLNPPGNYLEKKKGDLKEYMSIRVNDQWRICFKWDNNRAHEVHIQDYH